MTKQQEMLEEIQKFRLLDDTFMRTVFGHNKEVTQDVLRVIMGKEDLEVCYVAPQAEFKSMGGKSLWLDILARDSAGQIYNIEIQRENRGAGVQRARFNQSVVDSHQVPAGMKPIVLPEVYIIFFTENDVLGGNRPIYHVERVILETEELFGDGEHIIYVNGAFENDNSPLGKLISDFRQTDPNNIHMESLKDRVRYFKESEEGQGEMCKVMEEIFSKERWERLLHFVDNAKEMNLVLTVAQVVKLLDCPEEDVIKAFTERGYPIPH